MNLHNSLVTAALQWREQGYPCEQYPSIKYILEYNYNADTGYRFLRPPQFQALEIYWYLRLQLNTPRFLDLYMQLYPKTKNVLQELDLYYNQEVKDRLIEGESLTDILQDTEFIKRHKLETMYESLSLPYASYIFALAMGAGKTILIATIIATEFAMSLEYGGDRFMKNALVFAPDKTIIGSLREISDAPFDAILPLSDYQTFMANMRILYTQDNVKQIGGLIANSHYNIVITNTQKIILRKSNGKSKNILLESHKTIKQQQREYTANLRLQDISSLPSLGIFSDEAHHTYGNKVGDELKRVRETINHIAQQTDIIAVINTTGTPYNKKKVLKDVVYWYSLQQGIKDNILKSLHKSVFTYAFDCQSEADIINAVINDFFDQYGTHTLPNGASAKIAFYFKNKAHLAECQHMIEAALTIKNISASLILKNTEDATTEEIREFNSLNDPTNQKRVILLVQKGTEGWNCPSLFATALIREISSSNNFILQSATRCLRQVKGNQQPARIYIEAKNQSVLIKELETNFNITLGDLNNSPQDFTTHTVVIKKPNPPKLEIVFKRTEKIVTQYHRHDITLAKPDDTGGDNSVIYKTIYQPNLEAAGELLGRVGTIEQLTVASPTLDVFMATKEIVTRYHLPYLPMLKQLQVLYPNGEVPKVHIFALCQQIDNIHNDFAEKVTTIVQALAIIKTKDASGNDMFHKDSDGYYCHTIRYHKDTTPDILYETEVPNNRQAYGFHYSPYHFDSVTEKEFFAKLCDSLNAKPDDIRDVYFTGGLTSAQYTDIFFQYKDVHGSYRNYYPDFVVVKTSGEFIIVEIKAENQADGKDADVVAKEKAVRKIEAMPENSFKYHILYTDTPIPPEKMYTVEQVVYG